MEVLRERPKHIRPRIYCPGIQHQWVDLSDKPCDLCLGPQKREAALDCFQLESGVVAFIGGAHETQALLPGVQVSGRVDVQPGMDCNLFNNRRMDKPQRWVV